MASCKYIYMIYALLWSNGATIKYDIYIEDQMKEDKLDYVSNSLSQSQSQAI